MSWSDRNWASGNERQWSLSMGGGRPVGLFWLLGILVGAHVLKVLLVAMNADLGPWFLENLAYRTQGMLDGKIWTPISYQFVHGGIGHLFWNCFGIFIFGRIAEGVIGQKNMVGSFIGCGAAAVVFSRFLPHSAPAYIPVVGASGSLYAILGVLLVRVPNLPLNLILLGPVRLKWIVIVYVGMDLLKALGDGQGGGFGESSGVAVYVHLMGAAFGALYAWVWPRHIEPWWSGRAHRAKRRKQVVAFEREQMQEQELDRILDKINREGMDKLNRDEREFLKRRAEDSSVQR